MKKTLNVGLWSSYTHTCTRICTHMHAHTQAHMDALQLYPALGNCPRKVTGLPSERSHDQRYCAGWGTEFLNHNIIIIKINISLTVRPQILTL